MRWDRLDTTLTFGQRSAPKVFSAIVDWQRGYLPVECDQALAVILQVRLELGIPIAAHKTEGPTLCLTFLGTQIDTTHMESSDKLSHEKAMVDNWRNKKVQTKGDLQSLIGHVATVVLPGHISQATH